MPANTPQLGETWEFNDPQSGRPAQAVVLAVTSTAVQLMNRLGRTINVPLRSFLSVWRFIRGTPGQTCAHADCESVGYLRVQDLGNWVWVCENHRPAWVQPLLPTDNPNDESLPGGLAQCPCCGAAIERAYQTEEVRDVLFSIRTCQTCSRRWVLLIGMGDEEDGFRFADAVIGLAEYFEGEGLRAFAYVGSTALDSMRRAAGGLGSVSGAPQIAGVELQNQDGFGSNNIIVVGENPRRTGVQSLGPGTARVVGESILPETGTLWRGGGESVKVLQATRASVQIETAVGVRDVTLSHFFSHYTQDREHVQLEHGANRETFLVPQLTTIWETTQGRGLVQIVGVERGRHRQIQFRQVSPELPGTTTLGLREFLARYRPYLGAFEPPSDEERSEPLPEAGETWWHRTISRPVQVHEIGQTDEGERFVRFNSNNGPATTMLMGDFMDIHTRESPEAPCAEGDELLDGQEKTYRVVKVIPDLGAVDLQDSEGNSLNSVSWNAIQREFTKLERRTRADALMGDD